MKRYPLTARDLQPPTSNLHRGLSAIRGVVLNCGDRREALCIINHIVGEALYGDFPGTIDRIEKRWP